MNTSRPVVIGVSHRQPAAIRFALAEAKRRRAPLQVVHCHESQRAKTGGAGTGKFIGPTGSIALSQTHDLIKREAPSQAVTYIEVEGQASDVLLSYAEDAEMVVLGSGDASWLDWVGGATVSGTMVRNASCPVVSVPERCDSMKESGAVVVTIDGDSAATGPLSYGFEQAQSRDTSLIILHAVPVGTSDSDFDSHRANVAEVVAGWNELFPDVKVLVSSMIGDTVGACVSASNSASLVVIGRPHGLIGSFAIARPVAMSVMRRAQCAVAIVRADYQHDDVGESTRRALQSAFAR